MKIAVIVTARPSYARVKTAIAALVAHGAEVHVLACASALLERYGKVVDVIRRDFPAVPIEECWSTYEGANLLTSAKETGALLHELSSAVSRLRPDCACVVADRHEVLAAAQAVAYLHVPLVHVQGGERTGSIDDKVRDAITQLADVHLVSTEQAKYRVYGLTGNWPAIHVVGCPSVDLAKQAQDEPLVTCAELGGTGPLLDLERPFLVIMQHPVTSEMADAGQQMQTTLEACSRINLPRIVFWPGEDAGAEAASKAVRSWVESHPDQVWHTVRNLPPTRFLKLLTQSACVVGNSSVGIRECSYLGVATVNIGSRQQGRERAANVIDVPHDVRAIQGALAMHLEQGHVYGSTLYGDGRAGERIADVLCR